MKFQKGTRRRANEYEKALIEYWQKNDTFNKSVESRPADNAFVFYDGPPFLTGTPHHGHLLISSVKDAVARFWTMQGKRVERRWGWDCHGLPAELFVEKSLGIANKKEIGVKISIPDYVNACRAAMVKTGTEWEDTVDRIGRWVDFKGAYKTMDNEFMESVWWAFKELYEKGKIYEGEKILVYCTQDATPISKSEVAMENSYQKDTDPSVYVYFELEGTDESVLAWTTTPWTLPANVAVAVNPKLSYVLVDFNGKKTYVAEAAAEKVFTDEKHQVLPFTVLKKLKGTALVGKKYHPLFENRGPSAHSILAADFVTADDGTGIVHEAPAYGEEDYELCKAHNIPIVSIVDEDGNYTEGPWLEKNIWEVNKEIAKTLVAEGRALKVEYIVHDYPHCHRCGSKLMYRAHPSWFMDIQGQKTKMQEANSKTNWTPKALQTGRFANIIETAPDWNLSRDRYWATPIPVWAGTRPDGTQVVKVVGSYQEFEQLTGKRLDDYHLPNVMDVMFEVDGVVVKHIGKVLDCWFESGSMPFAQFHYPFENKQKFESSFPADFIVEAIDQTRGWFYSLTAVNVGLFGQSPFKNLICTGFINAADGKKMSKKLKNYTDPIELMDKYSADSFRLLLLNSPLLNGEDFALNDKDVADVARKLSMIWNMYDFFTLYAEVDKWEWKGGLPTDPSKDLTNPLDIWVVSRVHQLVKEVGDKTSAYNLPEATRPILPFIDDASNWFVRRSRKRFWKSDNDGDKQDAYKTLHYVLVQLSLVLAPFTPFLSEELYQKLTGGESVHLEGWPKTGAINEEAVSDMERTRKIVESGLGLRMFKSESEDSVKIRQPLQSLTYSGKTLAADLDDIIAEEVNVKQVLHDKTNDEGLTVVIDKTLTAGLRREGMMRDVVRLVQSSRKEAGLNVDDHIVLNLETTNTELNKAITDHQAVIESETLATYGKPIQADAYSSEVLLEGLKLKITLVRK
jgi:isoleucyl-tRNA synthetase